MTDPGTPTQDGAQTAGAAYAQRLVRRGGSRWKSRLDVQAPYRWNLQRLNLGRTLDIGCGIGRNLAHLGGNGVGVDHNEHAIQIARRAGHSAFTGEEFAESPYARPGGFDSMLLAHVIEHLGRTEGLALVREYLPYLRPGAQVVFICPQERGYTTDPTHVRFCDVAELRGLAEEAGLRPDRHYSFPLPRAAGKVFPYNEFVVISRAEA